MLDIIKLVITAMVGSGAAIAITKLIFERQKEERERADAIKHLALKLAIQFEGFVLECAQAVSNNQSWNHNHGHIGSRIGIIPEPQPLPTSNSYRFIEAEILNRIFGFVQFRLMAQMSAAFWWDTVGDDDCYNTAIEEATVDVAIEALAVAKRLRELYKFPKRVMISGKWNIEDFIRKEMESLRERNIERDKATLDRQARDAAKAKTKEARD